MIDPLALFLFHRPGIQLEAAVAAQSAEPERPERWGGYRLVPDTYEFWRHRDDRLHERHLFRARADGWQVLLLQP